MELKSTRTKKNECANLQAKPRETRAPTCKAKARTMKRNEELHPNLLKKIDSVPYCSKLVLTRNAIKLTPQEDALLEAP